MDEGQFNQSPLAIKADRHTYQSRFKVKHSIRFKLLSAMIGLIVILMLVESAVYIRSQQKLLRTEAQRRIVLIEEKLVERGKAMAENLGFRVENDIAAFNFSNLPVVFQASVEEDIDLSHIILMRPSREVVQHTARPELELEILDDPQSAYAVIVKETATNRYTTGDNDYLEIIKPLQVSTDTWGYLRLVFSLDLIRNEIQRTQEEIKQLTRDMVIQSFVTSLGFILLGIVMVTLISTKLSGPLNQLTAIAGELAKGNFDAARGIRNHSTDETGVLARVFAEMSDKLGNYSAMLEMQVDQRTKELQEKNMALKTVERTVQALNRITNLRDLLAILLDEGMKLASQSDRGLFLLFNHETQTYRVWAEKGFKSESLKGSGFEKDLAIKTFTRKQNPHIEEEVSIIREIGNFPPFVNGKEIKPARAILVITVPRSDHLEGFLIFFSDNDPDAFSEADVSKLAMFREHAITALEKADTLNTLQEKNNELIRTKNRLVQSEKQAALAGLVTGVAHEINTPIGVGLTAATHLKDRTSTIQEDYKAHRMSESRFKGYMEVATNSAELILRNLQQASDLVQNFKLVAVERSSEEKRTFNIYNALSELVIQLSQKHAAGHHFLSIDCDTDLELQSYPGAFSQILEALLTNALQHAFDEGQKGRIHIIATVEEDTLVLQVQDNGKGIPKEALQKIFEPFYTTRRGKGSLGLGLHIAFNLAEQALSGTIAVQSEKEYGTRFTLRIPKNLPSPT